MNAMGKIRLGAGEFRFEVVPSWPQMPRHWSFEVASDGAVNSSDEVYVFSRGAHPVTVWSPDGTFISSWGEGRFKFPHGIHIAPDDTVWLIDPHDHFLTRHKPSGEIVQTLGNRGVPTAAFHGTPFNMPTGMAVAPNGDLFVSDGYGNHRVHRFDADGELLLSWGKEGDGPGEFVNLHNIGVDRLNRVYICDRENHRIQIFDTDGGFLEEWTDLRSPNDLWIDGDVVYITAGGGVTIRSLDGDEIAGWDGSAEPLREVHMGGHGIWVDAEGSVYLGGGEVTKFQRV